MPQFNKADLFHVFNNCNSILEKLSKNLTIEETEKKDLHELATNYMICVLNDIPNSHKKLLESKEYLRNLKDKTAYIKFKEALRILRKVKHE
jgi:hypothetical protein